MEKKKQENIKYAIETLNRENNISKYEKELFVRLRLGQDINIFLKNKCKQPHLRFEFNQLEGDYIKNNKILFMFEYCGIFDYVHYLYIESWKGSIVIRYKELKKTNEVEIIYDGWGTVQIIVDIIDKLYWEMKIRDVINYGVK